MAVESLSGHPGTSTELSTTLAALHWLDQVGPDEVKQAKEIIRENALAALASISEPRKPAQKSPQEPTQQQQAISFVPSSTKDRTKIKDLDAVSYNEHPSSPTEFKTIAELATPSSQPEKTYAEFTEIPQQTAPEQPGTSVKTSAKPRFSIGTLFKNIKSGYEQVMTPVKNAFRWAHNVGAYIAAPIVDPQNSNGKLPSYRDSALDRESYYPKQ